METTLNTSTQNGWKIATGLAVFTVLYNIGEGLVSLYFGAHDEALTLAGFGVDSFIEVISGLGILAMITRLRRYGSAERGRSEKLALQITGSCFYVLVVGLLLGAGISIWKSQQPETTVAGIIVSVLSIVIMRLLASWKIRTGKQLRSASIIADGKCTMVCVYMSVVLLVSSVLYALVHLPFIDAAGMLGLAWFSFKEGQESFEKAKDNATCCDHC
ncbi:cation transporter [Spirosoma sp. KUDC1026]|uniref:cation transporter n=1 Tax=Spirosoma sp. KUDC1026 TaxID=2745947 RepID=UPI00159BA02C|nr:cation transporter [Spirosoma sp. KUDC1026]QKZ14910.1 cation transporter [Spirosoma sp. KUDC1026]